MPLKRNYTYINNNNTTKIGVLYSYCKEFCITLFVLSYLISLLSTCFDIQICNYSLPSETGSFSIIVLRNNVNVRKWHVIYLCRFLTIKCILRSDFLIFYLSCGYITSQDLESSFVYFRVWSNDRNSIYSVLCIYI